MIIIILDSYVYSVLLSTTPKKTHTTMITDHNKDRNIQSFFSSSSCTFVLFLVRSRYKGCHTTSSAAGDSHLAFWPSVQSPSGRRDKYCAGSALHLREAQRGWAGHLIPRYCRYSVYYRCKDVHASIADPGPCAMAIVESWPAR